MASSEASVNAGANARPSEQRAAVLDEGVLRGGSPLDGSQGTLNEQRLGAGCDDLVERYRQHPEVRGLDVGAREMLRHRVRRTRGGTLGVSDVVDRVDSSLEE
jgi:hypothetical protein